MNDQREKNLREAAEVWANRKWWDKAVEEASRKHNERVKAGLARDFPLVCATRRGA